MRKTLLPPAIAPALATPLAVQADTVPPGEAGVSADDGSTMATEEIPACAMPR